MRQLEGALSVEPLVQAGETFTVGKARFHVANTGKAVLEVQGAFEGNDQFSPAPESVSAEVLPGRDVSFEVDLRAPSPVPFSELQPGVARWTLRTTQADGTPVEHSQTSWLLPEKRFACVPVSETIAVDGALEDWGQLRFPVPRRPGEESGSGVSFAFDVRCDDATVYVGIVVRDPSLFLSPNEIGRHQDGISVVFDARPDPERSENQHFFAAAMSGATRKMIIAPLAPVQPKPDPVFDKFIGPVPDSVRRAARRTPGGYAAELAIPVAVLDERQGRPWDAFRMNVSVQDFDAEGNHVGTVWWRPSRMGLSTTPISGSGTFVRAAE